MITSSAGMNGVSVKQCECYFILLWFGLVRILRADCGHGLVPGQAQSLRFKLGSVQSRLTGGEGETPTTLIMRNYENIFSKKRRHGRGRSPAPPLPSTCTWWQRTGGRRRSGRPQSLQIALKIKNTTHLNQSIISHCNHLPLQHIP